MEDTQVGVRTRGRAMAMVVEETADNSGAVKRRKVGTGKLRSPASTFVKPKILDREIYINSAPGEEPRESFYDSRSFRSGGTPASSCSSTGSMEKVKIADPEKKVETGTAAPYDLDGSERRKTGGRPKPFKTETRSLTVLSDLMDSSFSTPTASEFKAESSVDLHSTTTKQSSVTIDSSGKVLPVQKKPSEEELEEFFAAAQEDLHKRFKNKYNYDIVNDIPLKGRFKWIHLKP